MTWEARAFARRLLEDPDAEGWTVQGFGMLRCYLTPNGSAEGAESVRLNVWHSALNTGASAVHTHPWDFDSVVIAGRLRNRKYAVAAPSVVGARAYWRALLVPGPCGGLVGEPERVWLALDGSEPSSYGPGETYSQAFHEIHETRYDDGTVTVNRRRRRGPDEAWTFWEGERGGWRDAKPRPATADELRVAAEAALVRLDEAERALR